MITAAGFGRSAKVDFASATSVGAAGAVEASGSSGWSCDFVARSKPDFAISVVTPASPDAGVDLVGLVATGLGQPANTITRAACAETNNQWRDPAKGIIVLDAHHPVTSWVPDIVKELVFDPHYSRTTYRTRI